MLRVTTLIRRQFASPAFSAAPKTAPQSNACPRHSLLTERKVNSPHGKEFRVGCAAQRGIHKKIPPHLSAAGNSLSVSLLTTWSCQSLFIIIETPKATLIIGKGRGFVKGF